MRTWERCLRLFHVLILVVVDNGLVLYSIDYIVDTILSLNPCCSGQWSSTYTGFTCDIETLDNVLILVVVDNGLVR